MELISGIGAWDGLTDLECWLYRSGDEYVIEVIEDEKCVQVERWSSEGAARLRMVDIVDSKAGKYSFL